MRRKHSIMKFNWCCGAAATPATCAAGRPPHNPCRETSRVSAPPIETSPGLNHAPPTPKNRKCLFQLLARVSLAWPPINDPSGERRSASPSLRWLSPVVVFPILFLLLTSVYPSRGVFFQRSQREAHFSILALILFCLILWDREFGLLASFSVPFDS